MNVIVVIPARYESSRFPGKPLALILGKPMIQWVYERVQNASGISGVYVATDDDRIFNTVSDFGGKAIMTGECSCGTDRIYQATKDMDFDIAINVQGDEPTISSEEIELLISAFVDDKVEFATLKHCIKDPVEVCDPNVVKVLTDINDDAIYFSRGILPYNREESKENLVYYRHIGIYGYRKDFLKSFVNLPPSHLEKIEKLEQLRAIENGYKIKVLETDYSAIGVDVKEQISQVEKFLQSE